jgi:endonuclease-3
MPPHGDGLGELVLTVLSQSTNDRNRDVAFLRLRERLPSWEAVRDAPVEAVERAIQPGGLHVQKSRGSRRSCGRGRAARPRLDGDAPVEQARAALCALPGVGRKTAACVLLFAFGRRDVPVDTHVSRVATRLGPPAPGAGFEELHDAMLALTRAARSSSCTSTSCATGGARARPRARPARHAPCGAGVRRRA